MQLAVHWQDADSTSAKAVSGVFPDAEIMICGGHAGRAHWEILELCHNGLKRCPRRWWTSKKMVFLPWVSSAVNVRGEITVLHVGA